MPNPGQLLSTQNLHKQRCHVIDSLGLQPIIFHEPAGPIPNRPRKSHFHNAKNQVPKLAINASISISVAPLPPNPRQVC